MILNKSILTSCACLERFNRDITTNSSNYQYMQNYTDCLNYKSYTHQLAFNHLHLVKKPKYSAITLSAVESKFIKQMLNIVTILANQQYSYY